jgi:hypothetical protein
MYPTSYEGIPAMPVDIAAKHFVISVIDKRNSDRNLHLWNNEPLGLEDILLSYFGSEMAQMKKVPISEFINEIRETDLPLTPMLQLLEQEMKVRKTSEVTVFSSKESENYFQKQYSSRIS